LTASARDAASEVRVGTKKRALRSNKETDEGQRFAALVNSLTKNAPYKALLMQELMREQVDALSMQLAQEVQQIDQGAAEAIDRPGRDHVDVAARNDL
jgi:hypothetical protein